MKKSLLVLVMTVVAAVAAMAQVTTSSLSGIVTDEEGGVLGATVQAIHTPSGTRYGTITNEKGAFAIRGMRVGGPYEVIVSYVGAETRKYEDINLELGETFNINVKLSENADVLNEVVVVGQGSKFASTLKTGASTNISNTQIAALPTVSRSITDMTRLSPYGGNGMTFSGTDGRTSNFTVDGANFNNNFGLSTGLPGGGNPISIDAIEEMQVVISPYDVRQTGFIGGGVNAITKSGTNTFKGTAYIYHKNENMQGDAVEREQITGLREKDQTTTYGFTFGGPIIKNKLFFFANAEFVKIPSVINRWRCSEDGVADPDNYIARTSIADMELVRETAINTYNYNPGSYDSYPADQSNAKMLARIDYNITENHHLAVRYNYTLNKTWKMPSSTSMDGGIAMSDGRSSKSSMTFSNSMYAMENRVHSVSVDLNSRISDVLSNQFLATFSKLDDVRSTKSDAFPFIDILKDGQSYISLGYELFSWNNAVHNNIFNVKDEVTYYMGNHKFLGGVSFENQMADNMYMRNGAGYFRYASVEDFVNDANPEIVNLTYGYDGEKEPASRVQYNRIGAYVQDDWNFNENLNFALGLRIDGLFFDNGDLMTNAAIKNIDFNGRHVDTGAWPDNSFTVSPRIGVTYDIFGDKSIVVRGGTGLFSGRLPLVFFTNMPTNSGMVQYLGKLNATGTKNATKTDMSKFHLGQFTKGGYSIDKLQEAFVNNGAPTTIKPEDGQAFSGVCGVDPDFKMPQVWKTSLAVDYRVPVDFPFSFTAEGIFNKTLYAATISNWAVPSVGGFARFNGADCRPIYPEGFSKTVGNPKGYSAFVLENTTKGYGIQASLTMNMKPFQWADLMVAYTHSMAKEMTSLPGSNAESAFTYVPTVEGPNSMKLHNSLNVTPDRLIASLNIHDKANNHYSFIYETWRGGHVYSYLTSNDMNGDGYNYDAIYIPTDNEVDNGQFRFKSKDDRERFMAYVHKDDYLSKHQGEYAEGYSVYSPFVHRLDFSYKHDFKVKFGPTNHKLQIGFDIKNVLNLFNSSWGVQKVMNQDYTTIGNSGCTARILKYEGADADGYAVFSTPSAISGDTKIWQRYHSSGQVWYMSIGAKYFFN